MLEICLRSSWNEDWALLPDGQTKIKIDTKYLTELDIVEMLVELVVSLFSIKIIIFILLNIFLKDVIKVHISNSFPVACRGASDGSKWRKVQESFPGTPEHIKTSVKFRKKKTVVWASPWPHHQKQAVLSSSKLELQTINSNVCHTEIFGKLLGNKINVIKLK